ncbi:MAG: bifunctional metallophosphatase/5'-nucleotidase [Dehalococcoidia bacterium]
MSRNRDSLLRVGRGLSWILATVLVFSSFLIMPHGLTADDRGAGEVYFTILHTNDLHSALIPHSPAVDYYPGRGSTAVGGIARIATAVEAIRETKDEPVLLLDAGDFLGGSAFAWLALQGYAVELTIMREMGYDALTIGNHEYDYGPDVLAQYLVKAGYPQAQETTLLLASNTEPPPNHPLAALNLLRPSGILELDNGLIVGVFGLIGEEAVSLVGDAGDVEFLDRRDVARQMVDDLKGQGADVIVVLSHAGVVEDRVLARQVTGIDIIVGGHCHTALHEPVMEGDTIVVQAGSLGMYLGQLELAYNSATGRLRLRNHENQSHFLIAIDDSFACHPGIAALVEDYITILNNYICEVTAGNFSDMMSTVARSDFVLSNQPPLAETPLGDFIADAMRLVTAEVTGEEVAVAVTANGVIRKSVFPGTIEASAGNVSFYEIVNAISLGYGTDGHAGLPIVSFYVTGEELRRLLEVAILLQEFMGDVFFLQFSGLRYSYNPVNAVLFTVPFIDLPIPTTRAVVGADLYTGNGVQPAHGEAYVPLRRGDEGLYRVATDYYILSFLPWVTYLLPNLKMVPKDGAGEPVPEERWQELVVRASDGSELKVWQAGVYYAAAQPAGADGMPTISDYYRTAAGRINMVRTFPFAGWLLVLLTALVVGIVFLVRRRRKRRKALSSRPA